MPIEHLALGLAFHQVLELLLAVDLDQGLGEVAQGLQGHELPIDVRPRAAVEADDAPHQHLAVVLHRLSFEPVQGARGQFGEHGRRLGAFRSVAYVGLARAAAGQHG